MSLSDKLQAEIAREADGAALLDDVHDHLSRFVVYPSAEAHVAHTLWVAHCHLMEHWESTPRIAFLSPEPSSGKTRGLEVTETLVPRPVEAINTSPAYIFRKVSDPDGLPTILYDEIDTLFGPRAKDNEEIRAVLNAGHRRGAMAGRCVVRGKEILTEELPAFCAVALAGLGNLPDTILSRSIVIRMRRRSPTERIEPYRRRIHAPLGHALRDRLAKWAALIGPTLVLPEMPGGVEDRDADVWESLLAVANAAGRDWPARARKAAVTLVTAAKERSPSLGVRLLADLRKVVEILGALNTSEEAPWGDLKGKPLDARRLAKYLHRYGVESKGVRIGERTYKGYTTEDLHDAWTRYLGPPKRGNEGNVGNEQATDAAKVTHVTDVTHVDGPGGNGLNGPCPVCAGISFWRVPGTQDWRCRRCRPTGRTRIETQDVITG
jgi:hypothetical protein